MSTYTAAQATIVKATSQGLTSVGALGIAGLQPGDVVVKVMPQGFDSGFEDIVSVADELQQITPLDWSSVDFTFYLLRGV